MNTPWGPAQEQKSIVPGITAVSTAGHGGIHLDADHNKLVPDYMRAKGGWYEEDCQWSIVAMVFPECFDEKRCHCAENTFRNWYPNQWEQFMGRTLNPGESHQRDEEVYFAEHKNDMLVTSAQGDWAEGVPKGFVRVTATRGGRRGGCDLEEALFLVPVSEYHFKGGFAFVVQPHHRKVEVALA